MRRTQVTILGAGPVGLVAAYALARRGVDVTVLEANADCAPDLRASTLHPPTLQMLDTLGLFDDLLVQGLKAPVYQYRNRRSDQILPFDLTELADCTPHPYRLQCEQFKLTRLIVERLKDYPNAQVLFQHRAISFEQDAGGVTVFAETPLAIERVRSDYVIAADGANSIARKWLNVEFEGFTYPEKFLTISTDTPIEDHFRDLAYVNYVADAEEWCVLLRVPTLWRVLVPADETDSDASLLSDEKKTAVFNGLVGDGASVQTPHRTIYRVHQRVAQNYTHGRVLLAGDAAHLNNPLGGLGMNSGIHDAWNLVEKLSAILLEGAPAEPLLARYDRQRRTVMNEIVQAQTINNKKSIESGLASQDAFQRQMESLLSDNERRRDYMKRQSLLSSIEREREIA